MDLNIVSLRSGATATESDFVGSGFLIDRCHVLTAKHVWEEAVAKGPTVYIAVLPHRDGALPAALVMSHLTRDATILRVIDWEAPGSVMPPRLAAEYESLNGRPVVLHAVSRTHGQVMESPMYSVSSYDNEFQEFELTPDVARGNSGGAVVHGEHVIGLVSNRAPNEPIARALALHSLLPWIRSIIGTDDQPPPTLPPPEPQTRPAPDSKRGIQGLSHRIGSIHLHVDGVRARDFVQELVARHNGAGLDAELAWVVDSQPGPQRGELEPVYNLHNPGKGGRDELDYFSTTQLHPGPDLPNPAQRRSIALDVHGILCELDALGDGADDVVIELERVVGKVDEHGKVEVSPKLVMRGTSASLEAMPAQRLFAPFNTRKVKPPGSGAYELHFSLDLAREGDGQRPPVALADLRDLVLRAGVELGGWFLFQDKLRWAYRSNGFVSSVSDFALQSRWRRLRTQLDESPNPKLQQARLRLLAEESLAVWRTPLMLAADGLRTVNALADWEQNIPDLEEFWVLLPNFLGDQNEDVRMAMLSNLNRGVRYVYFLRSNADARRWLDFRAEMQKEHGAAEKLMTAYVVAFRAAGLWDQLAAFVANPNRPGAEGFDLRIDSATNRVLYGDLLNAERLKEIVKAHSQAMNNDTITSWHLVQASGSDQNITAVCAKLLEEPSDELFARQDSKLALLASQYGGSVEVYGNKSITVVFMGHRTAQGHAMQFMRQALADCPALQVGAEPFVLRFGLACGLARLTARACGILWAGPAIRDSRSVLDKAPKRIGAYTAADANIALLPLDAGASLKPVGEGVFELMC